MLGCKRSVSWWPSSGCLLHTALCHSHPALQLDMEMSWMDREAIMGLMEDMVAQLFKQVGAAARAVC